ncbi:MAG: carbohydrate ABC transporter permease [Clostridia bacterium]|nr:carbohydrate ABC transporter permease [Clostridia bacterium]
MINKKVYGASGKVLSYIFRYVFFLSLSYIIIYPFIYIIVNSLKDLSNAYDATVTWVPKYIYFGNLIDAFKVFDVKNTFTRTVVYEIVASLIQFCSCAVAAYGLARFDLKGKSVMSALMIINILVPAMMIIIPSYVSYSHMDVLGVLSLISKVVGKDIRPNLVGTPLVFYLPALLAVGLKGGLFIYIFSQFFRGLPKELEEAAWIDGAGAWKTFLRIVIPSSSSAIITVLLFSIVWHWNDYYLAQMYMNEPTFSVAINNFSVYSITDTLGLDVVTARYLNVPMILAGCLLFMLPIIIFYLLMQRKFMASVATSGIVG